MPATNQSRSFLPLRLLKRRLVTFFSSIVLLMMVTIGFSGAVQDVQRTSNSFALLHATIIDGTGTQPKLDHTVVISGDRIVAVGPTDKVKVPATARQIDATGKYLIPGLWDFHVHTRYEGIDHLRLFIVNGITSVRDMGGPWQHLKIMQTWRDEISQAKRVGPRIWISGPILDGPLSTWSHAATVASPEEGRQLVQRLKKEKADFVKVYVGLSRESFFAIVAESNAQGLSFVGHVPTAITVAEASNAGQRSIEHASTILRDLPIGNDDASVAAALASAQAQMLFSMLKDNHTAVTPTLSLSWTSLGAARKDGIVADADRLRYIPTAYRKEWMQSPSANVDQAAKALDRQISLVRKLHAEGIEVLAGTDVIKAFFVPGFSLHDELSLLVKAGLSPMEAIESATRWPARFLGRKDIGTIENGMLADLVLLESNPLQDIANTSKIRAVFTAGKLLDKSGLDAMLADIERNAAKWAGTPTGR